jgi:hypothetical protein
MFHLVMGNVVVVFHLVFVLFVVFGGVLLVRWRRVVWIHAPSVVWGIIVELTGYICPLTSIENLFRELGGELGYRGDFLEQYILPILYPIGLTRGDQLVLGMFVFVLNIVFYWYAFIYKKRIYSN